jgi:hypothetical protein
MWNTTTRRLADEESEQEMKKEFGTLRSFAPVIINGGCRGHILRSAKGFRTFDRDDREIGTYPTPDAAVAALLELAVADAA